MSGRVIKYSSASLLLHSGVVNNSVDRFGLLYLYLFEGAENLGAQSVVVVVDDVFDLPRPVNHDTLQVLNEVLQAMSGMVG